ncbi:MAG: hypothetical protein VKN56_08525 [Cyanobacteriota bacterium]|nr:hypothetical protein [Cyanobacteriota bacterium]
MTQPLSPAAQAVLDAYGNEIDFAPFHEIGGTDAILGSERRGLAAALEALADQVTPLLGRSPEDSREDERLCVCDEILAIAAELRGQA